jgi:D-serine deaminase-like pyridoxal phosphate-dependent protein
MIACQDYKVANPDALETPAMLLFQDMMEHNIQCVCELVGGAENLLVHVKTHKSEEVVRRQLDFGIDGFKCATLKELEMVLQVGVRKAILTFPQVQECKIKRLCELASSYPDTWIATIVSRPVHIDLLASVCARRKQALRVMLDLDAGMHRTGIEFGQDAVELYRRIDADPFLVASGLHVYDGHQDFSDPLQREMAAQGNISLLQEFQVQLESEGMPVDCVVAGGSYSFAYYARTPGMYGSPGTFIYWDTGFSTEMPDMPFRWAALILTQVVDSYPEEGIITTDLGCKAISTDLVTGERAYLLGHDAAQLILQDEEHGVFQMPGDLPDVGDYLLAAPGHICPTTIRYPGIHVIDTAGNVVDYYLHTARDR